MVHPASDLNEDLLVDSDSILDRPKNIFSKLLTIYMTGIQ